MCYLCVYIFFGYSCRVSSASQLVEAISPYKRPRPQSPHGAHSIFYSPDHRFIQGGGHYTTNLYATAPQRDVRPHMQVSI